jgi:hypothetical protein
MSTEIAIALTHLPPSSGTQHHVQKPEAVILPNRNEKTISHASGTSGTSNMRYLQQQNHTAQAEYSRFINALKAPPHWTSLGFMVRHRDPKI